MLKKIPLISKIVSFYQNFGIPKEKRLVYYLQKIIATKTGFNVNKIKVLYVSKTNKHINQFNYFKFIYKFNTYELFDNKLRLINKKRKIA